MWKPGQIVTINHKICRVSKNVCPTGQAQKDFLELCTNCSLCMAAKIVFGPFYISGKLPYDCHLEEIKPKSAMG